MPTRRLSRTLALPAGCPRALLAPYWGMMSTGSPEAVDSVPNDGGVVGMHSRLDSDAHPLPLDVQPSLILSSRRARLAHAIQKRDGQKSSRAQGEVRDVRVHRRGRCRKPSYVSVPPRINGHVRPRLPLVRRRGQVSQAMKAFATSSKTYHRCFVPI